MYCRMDGTCEAWMLFHSWSSMRVTMSRPLSALRLSLNCFVYGLRSPWFSSSWRRTISACQMRSFSRCC
jgi:hypothetical protein